MAGYLFVRGFRIARALAAIGFALILVGMALPSKALTLFAGLTFAGSLLAAYSWRCPVCGNTFALRLGFTGIAMPYTNKCLHCGSHL